MKLFRSQQEDQIVLGVELAHTHRHNVATTGRCIQYELIRSLYGRCCATISPITPRGGIPYLVKDLSIRQGGPHVPQVDH